MPAAKARRESVYSLRNWTATEDERCRSLSHLGLLMPLYLSPMLYYKTVYTSCLYCLLLVLFMWAFNTAPKPAIAFLHMVNLPLLNIMGAEELAAQYLTLDALLLVILLYLVVLVDTLTDLVRRIAYTGCSRYGLRRNGVFLSLCGATFVGAMLISTVVLCVPLLYLVDRVFSVIYKESMDQRLIGSPTSRPSPASSSTGCRDVEGLFERLAVLARKLPVSLHEEQTMAPSLGSRHAGLATPKKGEQADEPSGHTSDAAVLQAKVPTITAEPRSSADSQRNAALPNHGPDDHAGRRATGDEAPMSPRAHRGGGRSKHGGKSAAGKDAGPHGPSKRRSKMADSRLLSPEGAQDAEELKSSEAVQSPVSPEGARAGEMPRSPGALLSAEYGSSAVASPGERTQLHDHTTGESHSHRRGRKGTGKKHLKSHKKESHKSAEASSKPGGNTQGILKASSPEDAVKASSPPPSSGNLQVEAALFSPTESAIKRASPPTETEDKASGVMGRRTLVIQESFLAASKERKASEQALRAQKDVPSPEELSLSPADLAATASLAQRRASILKQPGTLPRFTATTRAMGRRTSVVDFGADEYAAYVPGDVVTKPRILSDTSLSTQSVSQAPSPDHKATRKSISLRKQSREESRGSIRPSSACVSLNDDLSRKRRQMRRRADIHNAFLMGPSLMMMLGSLCSYWTGTSAQALMELAKNVASPEPDMTASSWCVLTLPGCVAALLLAYFYLSWVHVLPYEPDETNIEHSAAVQNAFAKLKALGTPSLAGALIVHGAVLALVMCVPAGYIGIDIRLTLLSLLTWTALLVSAFGSLFAKTAVMVRQAWCKMPWGIIVVLGGVQVATRVVEEYDLLPQLFKLFKPTFWTARSHIEVQAILATISSMLAETTNNRTLSLLMMPIVQDIAESKNMYPMYYAIPVVVGASSNVIMPISIPMVVMHDIGRVPFVRLPPGPGSDPATSGLAAQHQNHYATTLVLGIVLKMVLVGMVLLTVNAIGRTLYDWGNQHVVPDA
ncbi:uncharacterized protein [Dermacentor albipictus]